MRTQANSLRNATVDMRTGKKINSIQERHDLIDAINLEIDVLKKQQLDELRKTEEHMEEVIKNQIGVDQPFAWDKLKARN